MVVSSVEANSQVGKDQIKRSDALSLLRDIDHPWNRLRGHLLEEKEDINAQSIENLLKSSLPRKLQPDKPTSAPAAIAPSSEPKTPPKGKAKGKGKAMTAEQKAKTACIFHIPGCLPDASMEINASVSMSLLPHVPEDQGGFIHPIVSKSHEVCAVPSLVG